MSTAKLVFSCDSEDVLLSFNKLGYRVIVSLVGRGHSYPTNLISSVVFLFQYVVDDLTATIIKRCIPLANNRGVSDLIKYKVNRGARLICKLQQAVMLIHFFD